MLLLGFMLCERRQGPLGAAIHFIDKDTTPGEGKLIDQLAQLVARNRALISGLCRSQLGPACKDRF